MQSLCFCTHDTELFYQQNLTEMSESNLRADKHGSVLASGAIQIVTGDGRKGFSPGAPYDVIHVGAASPTMPQSLLQQLKAPGRMFVPVGTQTQDVWCVDKDRQGEVKMQKLFRQVECILCLMTS